MLSSFSGRGSAISSVVDRFTPAKGLLRYDVENLEHVHRTGGKISLKQPVLAHAIEHFTYQGQGQPHQRMLFLQFRYRILVLIVVHAGNSLVGMKTPPIIFGLADRERQDSHGFSGG